MFLFIGRDGSQHYAIVIRTQWGELVRFFSFDGYPVGHVPVVFDVAKRFGRFVRLMPMDGTTLRTCDEPKTSR